MNAKIVCLLLLSSSFFVPQSSFGNDQMTRFLKSCAYGALGGAAVGLVSISFSDDPGSKTNQVARGASLGLYAGIGYGYYQSQQDQSSDETVKVDFGNSEPSDKKDLVITSVTPLMNQTATIDGARWNILVSF